MRQSMYVVAVAGSILLTACGGSGSKPSPVPGSLSILAPSGFLFLGETYQFALNARLSDGTTTAPAATWGSDAPGVATVDAAGMVRIVGVGEATIFADFQGQRATSRVRTTVRYAGRVDTTAVATACRASGAMREFRACLGWVGSGLVVHAAFTQDGNTVVAVVEEQGIYCGQPTVTRFPPVTATIRENGELRFEAVQNYPVSDKDPRLTTRIVYKWTLRPAGLSELAGTVVFRLEDFFPKGEPGFAALEVDTALSPFTPPGAPPRPPEGRCDDLSQSVSAPRPPAQALSPNALR